MKTLTEIPRKTLRYKRSDISISYRNGILGSKKLELLNIGQQGMLIKLASNLKLHKRMNFIIKFDEERKFELTGNIVSKAKTQRRNAGKLEAAKQPFISTHSSVYHYGVYFNEADDNFKSYLLKSNIEKRLNLRALKGV